MILSLGYKQFAAVKAVASERHGPYLDAAEYVAKNRHDVMMPAAGWRALTGPLSERAFNKRGEWSSKHEGAGSALRTIVANLQALEAHPAYRGVAVVAEPKMSCRMLECLATGPLLYGPYPCERPGVPNEVRVLVPHEERLVVDLGAGAVEVDGVRWEQRRPIETDVHAGLFTEVDEHLGWSVPPS